MRVLICLCLTLLLAVPARAAELEGNIFIHDPSVIIVDGIWASFATGVELAPDGGTPRTKSSPDGITWSESGPLPGGMPQWIVDELGFTPRNIWAPSISENDGTWYLYYSASAFGKQTSVIGVMTHTAFDAADPATGWEDQGMVLRSNPGDDHNAIDPFRIDTEDGRAWLAFGSWWQGIRLTELDPVTGKALDPDNRIPLAGRGGRGIEAPAILWRDPWYYLFVSFDHCCRGVASDYKIMAGRSDTITGPYLDRDGMPMLEGGGTEILSTKGRYRGPGGQEIFDGPDGAPWLAFHYYDRNAGGAPKLHLAPLRFDAEGWPVLDPLPED